MKTFRPFRRGGLWAVLLLSAFALHASAATWFALGPFGGDARSISADPQNPKHLFLGTVTGWVYESNDGGATWARVSQIEKRNDLVVDHVLVDAKNPRRLIVGVWAIDRPDGGLYISEDGGKNWYSQAEMRGQSIRSMTRSSSNPDDMVAGTLRGVFRSSDAGKHWKLISPLDSQEIHEVESVAIDPANPEVIYAGTWHLPWKTSDGGAHWQNIGAKDGIIDDSDVFSIIIDPVKPDIVYASACSGIYKSVNAAGHFDKVQGIPNTARRTRKLMQDPLHLQTVFAGTTEGLYRTFDGGRQWSRTTNADVVVNDVYVDPGDSRHVLLATDRGGVLRSEDGGETFQPSNLGFSARQITSFAAASPGADVVYVGVVNDKETGGVFQSLNGGLDWQQQSAGLNGRDVFSLASTSDGLLLAGTNHGVFRLEDGRWADSSALAAPLTNAPASSRKLPESAPKVTAVPRPPTPAKKAAAKATAKGKPRTKPVSKSSPGKAAAAKKATVKSAAKKRPPVKAAIAVRKPLTLAPPVEPKLPAPLTRMDAVIYSMVAAPDRVLAGTSQGLMQADAAGRAWLPVTSLQMPEARFLAADGSMILVGGAKRLALSLDSGANWDPVALPPDLTQVAALTVDDQKNLWVGGREGVYYSTDYGLTWKSLRSMYLTQVDGIYFDAPNHRVLVTSANNTIAFAASLPDYKVTFWDTGWSLRFVRPVGDHLIGATLFDGMVVQPRMVDSDTVRAKAPGGR